MKYHGRIAFIFICVWADFAAANSIQVIQGFPETFEYPGEGPYFGIFLPEGITPPVRFNWT